jgi:hypothetical protein
MNAEKTSYNLSGKDLFPLKNINSAGIDQLNSNVLFDKNAFFTNGFVDSK